MLAARLIVGALAFVGVLLAAAPAGAELSGGTTDGENVGSWTVGGGPGGGVRPPAGTTSCSRWAHASTISPGVGPEDLATVRIDPDGRVWNLYFRICGATAQFVWVPDLDPPDLGRIAFDEVLRKLPRPTPVFTPDASVGGYVNAPTGLVTRPVAPVTATATIPGLSATATATVVGIEWVPGDGSAAVTCAAQEAAPCEHVYRAPSAPSVGGSRANRFDGSVTFVWQASWRASNGAAGDLGEARTTTPVAYRVREIQTIGAAG